jgi:hypothetical protein
MRQYMLAVRYGDEMPSGEEFRRLCVDVPAFNDKLTEAGAFVFHGGFNWPQSAAVVRQSGDDFLITDGPYAETKEHLAGFWIINAVGRDEALDWAKQAAVAQGRAIEVLPFEGRDIDELLAAEASGQL